MCLTLATLKKWKAGRYLEQWCDLGSGSDCPAAVGFTDSCVQRVRALDSR